MQSSAPELAMTVDKRRNQWTNCGILEAARLAAVCMIVIVCIALTACGLSKEQERNAVAAVTPWLEFIDAERYDEAWSRTLEYFRATTDTPHWNELMRAHRRPLGKVLSRSMDEVRREENLPGAPDANY